MVNKHGSRTRSLPQSAPLYPPDFPAESRDRVEELKRRLELEFDLQRGTAIVRNRKRGMPTTAARWRYEIESLLQHNILQVLRVFCDEAVRLHLWDAKEMERQCRQFLSRLIVAVYSEKGYDDKNRPLRLEMGTDGIGLRQVLRELEGFPDWRACERKWQAFATTSAPSEREQPTVAPERSLEPPAAAEEARKKKPAKGRPENRTTKTRNEVIRRMAHLKGEEYCFGLSKAGLSTPLSWQQEHPRCPKDYVEAWFHAVPEEQRKWHARMSDEKYKATHPRKTHSP